MPKKVVPSDLDIAQAANLVHINEIAEQGRHCLTNIQIAFAHAKSALTAELASQKPAIQ